jgi:hypothetical protein
MIHFLALEAALKMRMRNVEQEQRHAHAKYTLTFNAISTLTLSQSSPLKYIQILQHPRAAARQAYLPIETKRGDSRHCLSHEILNIPRRMCRADRPQSISQVADVFVASSRRNHSLSSCSSHTHSNWDRSPHSFSHCHSTMIRQPVAPTHARIQHTSPMKIPVNKAGVHGHEIHGQSVAELLLKQPLCLARTSSTHHFGPKNGLLRQA